MFGVVMAGGGGTRLWPKSREYNPKQMHALAGVKPLVQETTERLQRILGDDKVFIVANEHHARSMEHIMPYMEGRFIVDPYRKDTAPCIGLAAVYLSKIDPDAVMGVFPSDPYIGDEESFREIILASEELAEKRHVITVGIKPFGPETGYGYIETGDLFEVVDDNEAFFVRRFVEKPDQAKAEEYYAAGNYYWNSGMFIWSIPVVLDLYEKHLPDVYEKLMRIREAIGAPLEQEIVDWEYKDMQKISVDYGIMEKLEEILVIPGDFDWNDIGSWATVYDIAPKDQDGNAITGTHIGIDSKNSLIISAEDRIVATIGMENIIVVDTEDALLICPRNRAQDVKKIVDKLRENKLESYL